jgi:hypothetical protein
MHIYPSGGERFRGAIGYSGYHKWLDFSASDLLFLGSLRNPVRR